MKLESLVIKAQNGNQEALEGVVIGIQDMVYYLALRMLASPEDAKEATQEIIIRIITKLSTFEHNSKFKTWVYRVSTNYLINEKKIRQKEQGLTFERFKQDLESDLTLPVNYENQMDYSLLLDEVRIGCTIAMLLCLDPKNRMSYILGEILELDSIEASEVLGISRESFRQQVSRSRKKVQEFTQNTCGLVNECNSCTCEKKLTGAVKRGRAVPGHLVFADKSSKTYNDALDMIKSINSIKLDLRTKTSQQEIPRFEGHVDLKSVIKNIVSVN
jgi:RNA polymerase sigma factor (sigma-70 family)